MKKITIDAFFKKIDHKNLEVSTPTSVEPSYSNVEASIPEYRPSKAPRIESKNIDISSLERDPGLRQQISKYPVNQQDEIRRAYIKTGFQSWKKVNDGENCAFLTHVGKDPNSLHKRAMKGCQCLVNQSQHIEKIIEKQTSKQIANNHLRLKTSIDAIKWLTFQACAFRGHDERLDSQNRGNFLELLKMLASYNEKVDAVVLKNAPQNAYYVSHRIQKEILQIFSSRTRNFIRQEIGDAKFCIMVDESRHDSKREQMAIVLRFVDKDGFIREHFFDLVYVSDTT
ncbi:uncharacterized protein LOC130778716 [Actinidia eriantha]|uniref:uncharacterized protein LOC130774473 n=1 Tax=Actinidia eriantha TaxID=165200 RepID=UPI002585D896|nr:uncharacterized protein LOC130774473 [Actinidia eriantha]XP_057493208.1 uncharacterized protein LOC130778716 [Actinidia eriantha]